MDIFLLFAISIPVFYIWGIISFIKSIRGKNEDDGKFLQRFVRELSTIAENTPTKTAQSILADYKHKLGNKEVPVPVHPAEAKQDTPLEEKRQEENNQTDLQWKNWYSNNSINLLLYLGAFLIVMSASIFVSFQWETISGVTKASLLSLLTITFFMFGIWFHGIPKIKNAGATFIAIGGLLIPLCGAAWYNFVLKFQGVDSGIVWMITSILSLLIYIVIAKSLRNSFFAYVATISTLSFSLSLVETFKLADDLYILFSLLTGIVLYLTANRLPAEERKIFSTPLNLSSNILMPISLIFGLLTAIGDNKLFTAEAVISVILGMWFYILAYTFEKTTWKLAVGLLLLPFGLILFAKWQLLPDVMMLSLLMLCGMGYIFVSPTLKQKQRHEESDIIHILGIFIVVMTFLGSVILSVKPEAKIAFALCGMLAGAYSAYIKKQIVYTGVSSIFLAIALYILHNDIFGFSAYPQYLGLTYTGIGLIYYGLLVNWKRHKTFLPTAGLSCGLFLLLGLLGTASHYGFLAFVCITIAGVFFISAMEFSKPELLYGSNIFIYITIYTLLEYFNTNPILYPIYFSVIPYVLYCVSVSIEKYRSDFAQIYRYSALAGSLFTPVLSLLNDPTRTYYATSDKTYQQNTLMSAYTTTLLFVVDAYQKRQSWIMYTASALGMITYLWQIKHLHVSESLLYIIPIGIYFLALAYTRRIKKDEGSMQTFDYLGMLFLIVIPFFLSFGDERIKYSLVLLAEGLLLIGLGNSLSYKLYRYAGFAAVILAVLPQTYEYVLSLPRWLLVGLIGILLLGTAITLLLKRDGTNKE